MKMPDLPEVLVEEILCRVPATSLKKFRSTCQGWNRTIKDDRSFARKHSEKASKQFLAFKLTKICRVCPITVNLNGRSPSVEVKPELTLVDPRSNSQFDIYRVFHCDGLVLCNPKDSYRVVVWNPLTGETKWIESGGRCGLTFLLGYSRDSKSNSKIYKIMSCFLDTKESEIYEFNSDSWRKIDHDIAPGWGLAGSFYTTVCSLKGNTYWFDRDETKIMSLLMFDFTLETCVSLPLPYKCNGYDTMNLSVVREEKLSVLLQEDYRFKSEIWVTNKIDESTSVVSWTKLLVLDLSDIHISAFGSFLLEEEKKMVLWSEQWLDDRDEEMSKDMIYIVGEDNEVTLVDTGTDTRDVSFPAIFTYVPSLVQINPPGTN
ncbi:F-box protein [Cardamine amara subsp. amara]|uniref:F-box protein n=1 Tax=Cardamine amara subsp. amara TaxID=228776 RepID=A0ABD1BLT1_CARAN